MNITTNNHNSFNFNPNITKDEFREELMYAVENPITANCNDYQIIHDTRELSVNEDFFFNQGGFDWTNSNMFNNPDFVNAWENRDDSSFQPVNTYNSESNAQNYKYLLLTDGATISVSAEDGKELPQGMIYSPASRTFTVANLAEVTLPISVMVTITRQGNVVSTKKLIVTR
jgi:hypothetical protein